MAVASSSLAVGKNVPFTGPYVGAIAVQAYTGPFFGIAGMKLLREGMSAEKVVEEIMRGDPLKENRQILVIDAAGQTAFWNGAALPEFAGTRQGENCIVGGCGLSGERILEIILEAFSSTEGDFAEKLLGALAAFEKSPQDPPLESAAVRISKDDPFPYIDLRVDSHEQPVKQLAELFTTWRTRNGANGVEKAEE